MYRLFAVQLGIYAWCVALVSSLWDRPLILLLAIIVTGALMLYRWHSPDDLRFFFLGLILGPLAELPAVHFGAWSYSEPLYLVPIWLPFLWGAVALVLRKSSEALGTPASASG